MTIRVSIGFTMLFCSAVLSAADFRPLDVKTGQWETTVSGQTTGMPPIPDSVLNQLTPEQRAKMQAAMQANSGAKSTLSKHCMTQQDLQKGFNLQEQATKTCSHVVVTSTGSKEEIRMDCATGRGEDHGRREAGGGGFGARARLHADDVEQRRTHHEHELHLRLQVGRSGVHGEIKARQPSASRYVIQIRRQGRSHGNSLTAARAGEGDLPRVQKIASQFARGSAV